MTQNDHLAVECAPIKSKNRVEHFTGVMSSIKGRIKPLEFYPGIVVPELSIVCGIFVVPSGLPGRDFCLHLHHRIYPAVQARLDEHAQFNLRHKVAVVRWGNDPLDFSPRRK